MSPLHFPQAEVPVWGKLGVACLHKGKTPVFYVDQSEFSTCHTYKYYNMYKRVHVVCSYIIQKSYYCSTTNTAIHTSHKQKWTYTKQVTKMFDIQCTTIVDQLMAVNWSDINHWYKNRFMSPTFQLPANPVGTSG